MLPQTKITNSKINPIIHGQHCHGNQIYLNKKSGLVTNGIHHHGNHITGTETVITSLDKSESQCDRTDIDTSS